MSLFSYEVRNRVAEILFNNPPVNALAEAMLGDFLDALERASRDPEVRAVIIGSQVPGRFSAGLDLSAVHQGAHQKVRALLDRLYVRMTEVQFQMGKPTIAAVGGTARGGGMTIAISCDMIVASSDATFGYPEIDAGVLPSIHFTHLPRVVGKHRAFGQPRSSGGNLGRGLHQSIEQHGPILLLRSDIRGHGSGLTSQTPLAPQHLVLQRCHSPKMLVSHRGRRGRTGCGKSAERRRPWASHTTI